MAPKKLGDEKPTEGDADADAVVVIDAVDAILEGV